MATKKNELTPMMKQFFDLKAKNPDAILLFRCGDFYETYCDDAVTASNILGITLTRRNNGGNSGTANNNNGTANNGTANNGTTNDGLLNDTGDVLEDIGNGAGEALQDTGRALTGNNGTANRNGMY